VKNPSTLIALAFAVAAAGIYAQANEKIMLRANASTAIEEHADAQTKGRYKRQGDECQWDPSDTGPNQCTPQTEGRFKQDGDKCEWAANDRGPNQCTPKKGRFKKEGDKCVWNGEDSGPNQCNPRQPR
jgi:hypothetical protein